MQRPSFGEHEEYRLSHLGASRGTEYDGSLFRGETFDTQVWRKEMELLDRWITRWTVSRDWYLDFACGTGRILTHLERRFRHSFGIDISPDMLKIAATRVQRASLIHGDPTRRPQVLPQRFDCITAFRFFLNAQPELREEALALLASRLRDADSVLIFNIHGNRFSSRVFPHLLHSLVGKPYNLLSRRQTEQLVSRHRLRIVDWHGIAWLDKAFYNRMPRWLWHAIEQAIQPFPRLRRFCTYLYFVCKPL